MKEALLIGHMSANKHLCTFSSPLPLRHPLYPQAIEMEPLQTTIAIDINPVFFWQPVKQYDFPLVFICFQFFLSHVNFQKYNLYCAHFNMMDNCAFSPVFNSLFRFQVHKALNIQKLMYCFFEHACCSHKCQVSRFTR